jgi:hypothetical protein
MHAIRSYMKLHNVATVLIYLMCYRWLLEASTVVNLKSHFARFTRHVAGGGGGYAVA